MRYRMFSIAALIVGASISTAHAQATAKTVKCKDGTTSTATGSGACSGHGGVEAKTASTSKQSSKAAEQAAAKSTKTTEQTAKKSTKTAEQGSKKVASATKPGAKVTCTDGTLSKPGRGACSGHGGVKKS